MSGAQLEKELLSVSQRQLFEAPHTLCRRPLRPLVVQFSVRDAHQSIHEWYFPMSFPWQL
jgi:hypothetical protein